MYIDLKQLFDVIGETVEIDYCIDLSEYELFNTKPFITPVHVKGLASNRSGIITVSYKCVFELMQVCDRCLTEFKRSYDFSFEHTLVISANSDSDEYISVGNETQLDLDELVITDVMLNLPTKILCDENCKGLCSVCGINLNHKDCNCVKTAVDPRLAILGTLLED